MEILGSAKQITMEYLLQKQSQLLHINLWKFLGSEKQIAMENLQHKKKTNVFLLKCKYQNN